MNKKVIIFEDNDSSTLEKIVNDWLEENESNCHIEQIKYSTSESRFRSGTNYSVLIIYR